MILIIKLIMNFIYLIASPFIAPILIPFWLLTTMDVDPGISRKLPPFPEEKIEIPEINKRNIFVVLVNQNNQILYGVGSATKLIDIKEIEFLEEDLKIFITNNGKDPSSSDSPDKAIVSLQNHAGTSYSIYIQVQNALSKTYNELRNQKSNIDYGKDFIELDKNQQNIVKKYYPMKISEAEIAK